MEFCPVVDMDGSKLECYNFKIRKTTAAARNGAKSLY